MFQSLLLALVISAIRCNIAEGWFLRANSEELLTHALHSDATWLLMHSQQPNPGSIEKDPARQVEKDTQARVEEAVPTDIPPPATPPPGVAADIKESAKTAAEITGLKMNKPGDMKSVCFSFCVNSSLVMLCVLVFTLLRMRYPLVYSGNAIEGLAPTVEGFSDALGWFRASISVPTEAVADSMGLDNALLIEFCNLSMKILGICGLPMVTVMCPLHYFFGGGAMQKDDIRVLSMANVKHGHPWMYYLHAIIVNLVTLVVIRVLHDAMTSFIKLRCRWLKRLPSPRCTTVLVEGIPVEWRSDAKLKEFFQTCLKCETVIAARVVKNAPTLSNLVAEEARYKELLHAAELRWYADQQLLERRPMVRTWSCCGPEIDAINHYQEKLDGISHSVNKERAAILRMAEIVGGVNTHSGFVTFGDRRQAEIAKQLAFGVQRSEWVVSTPPPASDIRWADLRSRPHTKAMSTALGYACVFALYVLFIPLCIMGTNAGRAVDMGPLQAAWISFAPGLSLIIFLSFLPTVMLLIFRICFHLKADAYAQHKLQIWYFFFMVFFVILVTAIGTSLIETFSKVMRRPERMFIFLAKFMPSATQFYFDFMMLQWVTHALNFTRYINLLKFLLFRCFYTDEDAKRMAEPEDQDFYGIGSRSARFTINIVIGIVFSTLSPLIAIVTFLNFLVCRILYGYMIVFAEVKKPDLGGLFFVTQIRHVLVGTLIYNVLMIGVLIFRAASKGPMLIALPSLGYTLYTLKHFHDGFLWEGLPFKEVCFDEDELKYVDDGLRYIQPEFDDKESLL